MKIAIYPGTFDPFTFGHLDILTKATKLFDEVYLVVAKNVNKKPLLSDELRLKLVELVASKYSNVKAILTSALVVDVAKSVNAKYLIRGIRNHNDYEKEAELATINHDLDKSIETVLFLATNDKQFISSSLVRELMKYDQALDKYVPNYLLEYLNHKM